jgi:hypothetical protein
MIQKTFDESYLTQEALKKLRQGEVFIQKVSDHLYILETTQETGQFTTEALAFFSESFIQKLMSGDN